MTIDVVEVWLIGTDLPDAVLDQLEALLDDDERERAASLVYPARRRQFIASHGAVRLILGRRLGLPPGSLRWRRGPHGKPEIAGAGPAPQVSLSKSGSLAALAVAANRRVGVDIQRLLADLNVARMARRFYPPQEARFVVSAAGAARQVDRFTRLWVRKEACVKVSGGRLLPGLQLSVLGTEGNGAATVRTQTGPYLVRDLGVPPGFRAALAAEGTRPFRITRHWMNLRQPPAPCQASEIETQLRPLRPLSHTARKRNEIYTKSIRTVLTANMCPLSVIDDLPRMGHTTAGRAGREVADEVRRRTFPQYLGSSFSIVSTGCWRTNAHSRIRVAPR